MESVDSRPGAFRRTPRSSSTSVPNTCARTASLTGVRMVKMMQGYLLTMNRILTELHFCLCCAHVAMAFSFHRWRFSRSSKSGSHRPPATLIGRTIRVGTIEQTGHLSAHDLLHVRLSQRHPTTLHLNSQSSNSTRLQQRPRCSRGTQGRWFGFKLQVYYMLNSPTHILRCAGARTKRAVPLGAIAREE